MSFGCAWRRGARFAVCSMFIVIVAGVGDCVSILMLYCSFFCFVWVFCFSRVLQFGTAPVWLCVAWVQFAAAVAGFWPRRGDIFFGMWRVRCGLLGAAGAVAGVSWGNLFLGPQGGFFFVYSMFVAGCLARRARCQAFRWKSLF